MKINRAAAFAPVFSSAQAFSCAMFLLLASCSAPQVVPPPPPSAPRPAPATPPPPPPASAFKDWRDAPQTPGNWRYEAAPGGSVVRYGSPGATVFAIACNRTARTVSLIRSGTSAVSLPMSIATTSEIRALFAEPARQGTAQLVATLAIQDPLLDAMAFSRGRFAVEVNGLPTLYLPAWAEMGRVVEDCRRG
jgi:hypothetical protein